MSTAPGVAAAARLARKLSTFSSAQLPMLRELEAEIIKRRREIEADVEPLAKATRAEPHADVPQDPSPALEPQAPQVRPIRMSAEAALRKLIRSVEVELSHDEFLASSHHRDERVDLYDLLSILLKRSGSTPRTRLRTYVSMPTVRDDYLPRRRVFGDERPKETGFEEFDPLSSEDPDELAHLYQALDDVVQGKHISGWRCDCPVAARIVLEALPVIVSRQAFVDRLRLSSSFGSSELLMESHRTRRERIEIRSIAKISADILVFTSTHEHCIRSVDVCSEDDYEEVDYVFHKETQVFAGRPNESGMQNGACENAQFNLPRGICYDAVNDRVLVCDTMNHRICVVEDGHVSTLVGTGASGNIDGHLDEASFNFPISVACASNYIVISEVHRIRLIMNNTVTTLGGSNSRSSRQYDGNQFVRFHYPAGLCISNESVFIADDNRVRMLRWNAITDSEGGVHIDAETRTIAGRDQARDELEGEFDGPTKVATFTSRPNALAVASDGTIYIAQHDRVRIIRGGAAAVELYCVAVIPSDELEDADGDCIYLTSDPMLFGVCALHLDEDAGQLHILCENSRFSEVTMDMVTVPTETRWARWALQMWPLIRCWALYQANRAQLHGPDVKTLHLLFRLRIPVATFYKVLQFAFPVRYSVPDGYRSLVGFADDETPRKTWVES